MLQDLVQSPQFVQESLLRLILYNLFLKTTASNAPKWHRYRQKKRPTNNEATVTAKSAAKLAGPDVVVTVATPPFAMKKDSRKTPAAPDDIIP